MREALPSLRRALPLGTLFFLCLTLVVLYALSSRVDSADLASTELKIRDLITLDTDLDLDVLNLRHRQLFHYDGIAEKNTRMDHVLASLEPEFRKVRLEHALRIAQIEWERRKTDLEDFKRQNSVLVNSQYHFVRLSNEISRELEAQRIRPNEFSDISRNVLIFLNGQSSLSTDALLRELEELAADARRNWPSTLGIKGQILAAHGAQIIKNHPSVQALIQRITGSEFPNFLELAYAEYLSGHNLRVAKAETYRQLMAIFALIMIGVIVLIVARLRNATSDLTQNHALLDNITNHLAEGILSFDADGRLNFVNQRAEKLLERDNLVGQTARALFPQNTAENSGFLAALANNELFEGEEWLQRAGTPFPAVFLGGPLLTLREGRMVASGYVTSFRDVSVQRESETHLRLASRVFDNLSEALSVTDSRGVIESVNAAFTTITGYTEMEARGHTPGELLKSGQHDNAFYQTMWDALARDGNWQGEITDRRKTGELYQIWLSITVLRDSDNQPLHYIGLFSDISERKRIEARVYHLAYHDSLTQLANRFRFIERLESDVHEARQKNRALTIMLLDLDRFKYINDSLGHAAGDVLLKSVSQRLQHHLREGDLLARAGGDEFSLLLPGIAAQDDITAQAKNMLSEFDAPFNLHGREVFISSSIGIATYPYDGESAEILLKNADTALNKAKSSGHSSFCVFQKHDNENSLEHLELESELRHSVQREELRLYYQPQIDAKTGRVFGTEALIRWQHPVRGLLPPDRFISLAELSGYIETLGSWCLHKACSQFVAWRRMGGMSVRRMAVNVSARQLSSPVFIETILETIEATGIDPNALELELTESAMIHDPEQVFGIFTQLREHGIRIAIDDFGTGYSSLAYLSRYPVDVLKIDRSFVQNLGDETQNRSVVEAIILMAHTMGMEVVAEGVETEDQSRRLKDLGCDFLQGFLYSRPCAPEQIQEIPSIKA